MEVRLSNAQLQSNRTGTDDSDPARWDRALGGFRVRSLAAGGPSREENSPMRTRAGWIALVLTGGLALAPAAVRAQGLDISGREAEPTIPLPVYSSRPEAGGFYAAVGFVMMRQTRELGNQIIARRGLVDMDGSIQQDLGGTWIIPAPGATPVFIPGPPGAPGTFLGTGTPALSTSDLNGSRTYQPGWDQTIGWRFSDGSALESRWRHVHGANYQAGADIIGPGFAVGPALADTFLFAPVYNFPNNYAGPAQETALGNPGAAYGIWNGASGMTIEFTQRYDQIDTTYRVPVREDPISRTYIQVGARFAWIWERFKWRTVAADLTGATTPQDVAIYTNIVSNRMYGPTIGVQHDFYLGSAGRVGGFSIGFVGDFSPLLNVVKERARYELSDESTSTKLSRTEYTFVPMVSGELNLTWYPAAGVQIRLGWSSLAFMNTVYASRPVAFNYGNLNNNNDFGVPPNVPAAAVNEPIWQRKALRYFDGISFGAALSF